MEKDAVAARNFGEYLIAENRKLKKENEEAKLEMTLMRQQIGLLRDAIVGVSADINYEFDLDLNRQLYLIPNPDYAPH
jgi:hypothetical protein